MKTFEDFLQDQHAKNYMGTDDDMSDNFEQWLIGLDNQELIDYANQALTKTREDAIGEMLIKISKIPKIEMTFSDIKERLKDK